MITLKTLGQATAQEVFDQVATHLLTQGKPSMSEGGGCFYRRINLKCAAGCLISDEEYLREMDEDDSSWEGLINRGLVPKTNHSELIQSLQAAHDNTSIKDWIIGIKQSLGRVAKDLGLSSKIIENFSLQQENSSVECNT